MIQHVQMIQVYFHLLQSLRLHYLDTVELGCRDYGYTLKKAAQNVIDNQRRELQLGGTWEFCCRLTLEETLYQSHRWHRIRGFALYWLVSSNIIKIGVSTITC
jgi:hypothetical protein